MEKEEKKGAGIDKDVIETMKYQDSDIIAALEDDKSCKRFVLNCFCEMLSEIKQLNQEFNDLMETISICSADKLEEFFKEVKKNVAEEKKRLAVQEKIEQSHKKPSKSKKKSLKA